MKDTCFSDSCGLGVVTGRVHEREFISRDDVVRHEAYLHRRHTQTAEVDVEDRRYHSFHRRVASNHDARHVGAVIIGPNHEDDDDRGRRSSTPQSNRWNGADLRSGGHPA